MKYITFFIAMAVIASVFSSCHKVVGEGEVVSQNRQVSEFTGIEVHMNADVFYSDSTVSTLRIEAQPNILQLIGNKINGNTLSVFYNRDNVNIQSKQVKIYITSPKAGKIDLSGSANLFIPSPFQPADFSLSLSGSCNASINELATNNFNASISGSGRISVSAGNVTAEIIKISGSGDVDMLGVQAKKATAETSGSGTINVSVTDELTAHISGSGKIYYKGNPVVDVTVSGSGSVVKL